MPYKRPGSKNLYITVNGVRQSARTDDWAAAEALEHKLNHQVWLEKQMGIKPPRSWQDAVAKYLPEVSNQAGYRVKVAMLKWWHQYLGNEQDIRTITRDRIDDILTKHYANRRGEKVGPEPSSANATANHYVACVSAILTAACREWDWIERAPKFRYYETQESGGQVLTPEEWLEFKAMLPWDLAAYCQFALATGLRSGKFKALKWADIRDRRLDVWGNANKRAYPIPLNETALEALESVRSRPVRHMVYVWPQFSGGSHSPIQNRWHTFQKVRERFPGIRIHDLRHTFNTWLAEGGVPEDIRARLVGHSTGRMQDRYTHMAVDHLREYVRIIDTKIAQAKQKTGAQQAQSTAYASAL